MYVFFGIGDIIIGVIVVNFVMLFFKFFWCFVGVVVSYLVVIVFLS